MQSSNENSVIFPYKKISTYALKRWSKLTARQKGWLKKTWSVITYKWRWQIAMNVPYLAIFALDRTIPAVHQFDMNLLASVTSKLPIPELISKSIGLV